MSAKDVGLATPESVAYDPVDDTYLPAGIGSDSKRKRVLVPMFQDNAVLTFGM